MDSSAKAVDEEEMQGVVSDEELETLAEVVRSIESLYLGILAQVKVVVACRVTPQQK